MTYLEAAKGFRYGGLNQPVPLGPAPGCGPDLAAAGLSDAPATFGPDHLWTYSLGEKSVLMDRSVYLNATAFFTRWSDVQTRHLLASCGYYFLRNKGEVTSTGLEVEAKWQATTALAFALSVGYTDAKTDGPIPDLNAPDGSRAPYFPKLIASFETDYKWNTPIGTLLLEADYSHRGNVTTAFATADPTYRVIPSTDVVNASATLQRGNFDFTAFARNLTNERIITAIAANLYGNYQPGDQVYIGRPVTLGIKAAYHF
jgi:outer membrane receptor protein involved in Fe transport